MWNEAGILVFWVCVLPCRKSYAGPDEEVSVLFTLPGRQGLSSHWNFVSGWQPVISGCPVSAHQGSRWCVAVPSLEPGAGVRTQVLLEVAQ